jgi:hypothetical protein
MSYEAPPPPPPPPPGYGQQPGWGYGPPRDHPKAQQALIFGILGLVCCGLLAIPAFIIGNNAVKEIDASGGTIGGRGMANAGKILGIIGMAFFALGVIYFLGVFAFTLGSM